MGLLIASVKGFLYLLQEPLKSCISDENVTYFSTWQTYHLHLAQVDLHITHGGIDSIKDSLSCAVPMLICPLDWKSDQIHNALMFEKIGLAQIWNIKKNDPEGVCQ